MHEDENLLVGESQALRGKLEVQASQAPVVKCERSALEASQALERVLDS